MRKKSFGKLNQKITKLQLSRHFLTLYWRRHMALWNIFTHLTPYERVLLYALALKQKSNSTIVEIGSYLGASSSFLAAGAKDLGNGTLVHCIDTWENEGMTEGPRDTWIEFINNTKSYSDYIIPHRGNSIDMAKEFDKNIDFLFIDADHSYESCKQDAFTWLGLLNQQGIIMFHDYGWAEGVQRVVADLRHGNFIERGTVFMNLFWAYKAKD